MTRYFIAGACLIRHEPYGSWNVCTGDAFVWANPARPHWDLPPRVRYAVMDVSKAIRFGEAVDEVFEITDGVMPRIREWDIFPWEEFLEPSAIGFRMLGLEVPRSIIRKQMIDRKIDMMEQDNRDSYLMKAARGVVFANWRFSDAEWSRYIRDGEYRVYRADGKTIFLDPWRSLMEKYGVPERRAIRMFLDAQNGTMFALEMRELMWAAWTKEHAKAYNRKRRLYVNGVAQDFRLRDEFPDYESLGLNVPFANIVGGDLSTIMLDRYRAKIEGIYKSFNRAVETIDKGKIRVRELVTAQEFRDEGKEMGHCIGGGGYFQSAIENSCRAFAIHYGRGRYTITMGRRYDGTAAMTAMYGRNDRRPRYETESAVRDFMAQVYPVWIDVVKDEYSIEME